MVYGMCTAQYSYAGTPQLREVKCRLVQRYLQNVNSKTAERYGNWGHRRSTVTGPVWPTGFQEV